MSKLPTHLLSIFKAIAILLSVYLSACSFMPPRVSMPVEAEGVVVFTIEEGLPEDCKALGEVLGYGSDEEEATFDIQYNAAVDFEANAVLIRRVDDYYQNKRLINYFREPQLFARKGTVNYKYVNAFTFKARGMAVLCSGV